MADYIVNTDRDDTEADAQLLSLREAVALANANANALDTIAFADGVDLVRLTQGTQIEITDDLLILGRTGVTITGDSEGDDIAVPGTDITDLGASDPSELDDNTRIFLVSGVVDVTLRDLVLTGGRTRSDDETGGAVSSDSPGTGATLTFDRVTIAGNETIGDRAQGGGVYADAVTLRDSTISGNRTLGTDSHGGGVFAYGTATLVNTTVFGNATRGPGANGGGLDIGDGSLINVTVTGNEAVGTGGGLQTYQSVTSTDSIFIGNESAEDGAGKDVSVGTNTGVTFTFDGRNLIGEGSGIAAGAAVEVASASDVFAEVENGAGVLADNGGPTRTVLILAGGPAQDAGTGSREARDQRGEARSFGDERDIGALELQETASLRVTTEADVVADDGLTSLREAVLFANAQDGADTITFAEDVGLMRLTRGEEIEITDTLTIDGGDGPVTIDGEGGTRLFNVTDAVDTTFRDLVLTRGRSDEEGVGGGAVWSAGSVTLEDVTLTENLAATFSAGGGAVYAAGDITLTNGHVIGNESRGGGGGLRALGDVTVTDATIGNNSVRGNGSGGGGGIFAGGTARLTDVIVSDNYSFVGTSGGGIFVGEEIILEDVRITGNSTGVTGGGGGFYSKGSATLSGVEISGNEASYNGGFRSLDGATLRNVTVVGNESSAFGTARGGGFFVRGSTVLENVTVTGNSVEGSVYGYGGGFYVDGQLTLVDSIVLGNASNTARPEFDISGGSPAPVFQGLNIVGADRTAFDASVSDNVINAAPSAVFAQVTDGAGVLADNGGPTRTVLILPDGAAQGAGRGAGGPDTDQRGVARPQGEGRDIGALELRAPPVLGDDRVILPFASDFIPIASLLENDMDSTGAEIIPGLIIPAPFETVRFINLDLALSQTAVDTLAAAPVGPDGAGGGSVAFTYSYFSEDGVLADPAEVIVQMAARLRLREATAEAEAGGRAVVDLSALREGGFGDVTISLGPLRATDGGGDGIGSVALAGDALVFTAAAGAEGRAGSVDVTLVDALGQVGGATVALDVAEAPKDGGGGSPPIAPEPQPEPDSGDDDDGGDGGPDIPASPGNEPEDRAPDTPAPPEEETGRVLLRGTESRDRIFGTAADERFEGLGARDVLVSGGGDDLMIGGDGPDFFAFARIDAPGRTEVEDFGPQDFLVLDDRFFGLGDATIDLRGVTLEQVLTAVRAGLVALDRGEGTLSIDPGRDARGDGPELTITLGDGLADLGVADVFLV